MTLRVAAALMLLAMPVALAACRLPGAGRLPEPGTIELSAEYDRAYQRLSVEVEHSASQDMILEILAPDWITILGGARLTLAGGSAKLTLDVAMDTGLEDTAEATLKAAADDGAEASATVEIARPFYIENVEMNPELDMVVVTFDADPNAGYAIDLALPEMVYSIGRVGTGSKRSVGFPLEIPPWWREIGQPTRDGLAVFDVTVVAYDKYGNKRTGDYEVAAAIPELVLAPRGLYAVPQWRYAPLDGEVIVTVYAGDFPAGAPFRNLDGVAVTIDQGVSYVDGSFNAGLPGGEWDEPDGLWASMDPPPVSILGGHSGGMVLDWMPERIEHDFSAVPVGGGETTRGGALFNFRLAFEHGGAYTLGLIELDEPRRTCYSDDEGSEYSWSDLSNEGVPNEIYVIGVYDY